MDSTQLILYKHEDGIHCVLTRDFRDNIKIILFIFNLNFKLI